jgi:hypothetical protein
VTYLLVALAGLGLGALLFRGLARNRDRRGRPAPGPRRVRFPFVGAALSSSALDAALRISRADAATLVPAYLASVPLHSPLAVPLPRECDIALPLLEAVEQRAHRAGVPVDARIERGRTHRHAFRCLVENEHFDRIVVAAGTGSTSGFTADDVAWLLREAPGEIVVLRPADEARVEPLRRVLEGGTGLSPDARATAVGTPAQLSR